MQKVRLNDLSDPVRSFLAPAGKGEVIIVEDDSGRAAYSVVPIVRASAEIRQRAWNDILRLQQQVGESMKRHGITEDDIDRELRAE